MIRIYEKRGYSAAYIRNMLSQLKKDGYADSPSRSTYRITGSGRSFIRSVNRKPQLYGQSWDGQWHLVLMSFPETERKRRDRVRADLLQTGFGQLQGGVYVSPWAYREELADLLQRHEAQTYATVFTGRLEQGRLSPEQAADVWALADIAARYADKLRWLREQFEPAFAAALNSGVGTAGALELFVLYLALGEQINELCLADPMLPLELLPQGWTGQQALERLLGRLQQAEAAIPRDSEYARFVR
ncbi:PaaX family transcriptional regulator C-terminal domain-containing protein [Paenibacillus athensensis]|uniref:PaaX family transcriptional regulator C-terminal domain-containing protein n=1 Tax=Paenibacillus athensensis TaxID=1967502 RepID=UPI001E379765|nr:PaaX family transcriptional regulator C-terminal domain-containing protein [Paenibacillus athensensis]